jgi:hypothetical protein
MNRCIYFSKDTDNLLTNFIAAHPDKSMAAVISVALKEYITRYEATEINKEVDSNSKI